MTVSLVAAFLRGGVSVQLCASCDHTLCGQWRLRLKRQKRWPTKTRRRYARSAAEAGFAPEHHRKYIRGGMAAARWIQGRERLRSRRGSTYATSNGGCRQSQLARAQIAALFAHGKFARSLR